MRPTLKQVISGTLEDKCKKKKKKMTDSGKKKTKKVKGDESKGY